MIFKAPDWSYISSPRPRLFLAGSIENGQAIDWQAEATRIGIDSGWTILNPRREDWDWSWEQSITNPLFKEQVDWELDTLHAADGILMYFAVGTKSPISLLEFGLFARSEKMVVVCPDGFWRKGNVDIVCKRYGIPQRTDIPEAIATLGKMYAVKDYTIS